MAQHKSATGCSTKLNVQVEHLGESTISTDVSFNSSEMPTAKGEIPFIEVSSEGDVSQSIPAIVKEPAVNQETHKSARKRVIERNFTCDICGKKFLHSGHYNRHCEIHNASTLPSKKLKSVTVHPDVNGEPEASTTCSFYDYSNQGLYQSDVSLTEHKQTINRSFVCEICGKGFGRNSHLRRHLKLHNGSDSLSVQKEQPKPHTVQVKSSILQATQSDSDNSGTLVEHNDSTFSDISTEQIRSPTFVDPSEVTMVKSESSCSPDVLNKLSVTDKSLDVVESPTTEKVETKLLTSNSFSDFESSSKAPYICEATLSESLEESEDFADDAVNGEPEASTNCSFYDYSNQGLYQSDVSLTEHKQTINRSFICVICGKGFGRNSHLRRHLKLHNGSDSLTVQKKQPKPHTAQVKSLILQATQSDSDNSETLVEHNDSTSSNNLIEQIRSPTFIDPSEVIMVKSESSCSADVLNTVSVTDKSLDVVQSPTTEKVETELVISNSCNAFESTSKSPIICEAILSKSLEESEDFVDDEVYVKMEQSDHSIVSNESVERMSESETHSWDSSSVDMMNHEMGKELFCTICGKKFGRKSHLTRHVKLHVNREIHDCEICGKRFLQSAYLKAHVSTVHATVKQELEKIYACPICDKKFGRMSHLKRHMKLHVGGETYDCRVCGKKFLQNSNLKSHEKSHADLLTSIDEGLVKRHVDEVTNTEYFDCEQCGKSFQQMSSLKAHINTVHIGNKIFGKTFECSFCGKEFGRNSHLKRHLKLHTGGQIFTCELCGRGFKQNGNLKAHIRMVHLKERPHECTFCGKMFLQQSNLNTHMRTHTGEKPYGCTICGKNFTQGNQLKYHMRTHYGETPFSCYFCGKTFTNNRSCQRHMKMHESDNPEESSVSLDSFTNEKEARAHLKEHRKKSVSNSLHNSRKYDSSVDSVSEEGEFDSDEEYTSDNVTFIKEEPDVVVKEEPEVYECGSDYESTNESEALSSVVGDDVGQDSLNIGSEGNDFQDVIKSVNESIKDMTRNKTLILEQADKDPTDTSLGDNHESLEGTSVDVKQNCSDPLDGF